MNIFTFGPFGPALGSVSSEWGSPIGAINACLLFIPPIVFGVCLLFGLRRGLAVSLLASAGCHAFVLLGLLVDRRAAAPPPVPPIRPPLLRLELPPVPRARAKTSVRGARAQAALVVPDRSLLDRFVTLKPLD